jgi:hypothetical protein
MESAQMESSQHLIHRLPSHATRLSLVASARHIVDTVLRGRWWQIINPLLSFHSSSIRLTDAPRARRQVQRIGRNEVFALRRHPLGALAGRDVHDVHGVDFFQAAASGFTQEEVDDCGA